MPLPFWRFLFSICLWHRRSPQVGKCERRDAAALRRHVKCIRRQGYRSRRVRRHRQKPSGRLADLVCNEEVDSALSFGLIVSLHHRALSVDLPRPPASGKL